MKINSWKECIELNKSLIISSDKAKAKSLLDTAKARICFAEEIILKYSNANFVFELYYTSLIEILHAIVLYDGFKVENHVCLGYYLLDVLKKEPLYRLFDACRFKRNSLVYYGNKMDYELALELIEKAKKLIKELLTIENFA